MWWLFVICQCKPLSYKNGPKHDIGNMLNKAIAAVEDENDALAGVLKNNIDFNAEEGKTKTSDQKMMLKGDDIYPCP